MKQIVIGSDHGGYECKQFIVTKLQGIGYDVIDVGTYSLDSCNYPEFALKAATKTKELGCFGVVICTTGEGVCMMANKVKGIRCGVCYNEEVASLMKQHNNANMISFGAKFFKKDYIWEMLQIFLNAEFLGGRHEKRVNMIIDYENESSK